MGLKFQPLAGQILICEFPREFQPPEMTKKRPVVVLTPPHRTRQGLVTVAPLSTTAPRVKCAWQVPIQLEETIRGFDDLECWVKCDMIYNFAFRRLNLPFIGKDETGKRIYQQLVLPKSDMFRIYRGVISSFGFLEFLALESNTSLV